MQGLNPVLEYQIHHKIAKKASHEVPLFHMVPPGSTYKRVIRCLALVSPSTCSGPCLLVAACVVLDAPAPSASSASNRAATGSMTMVRDHQAPLDELRSVPADHFLVPLEERSRETHSLAVTHGTPRLSVLNSDRGCAHDVCCSSFVWLGLPARALSVSFHLAVMYRSEAGGCCDCGDETAWKPSGYALSNKHCCPLAADAESSFRGDSLRPKQSKAKKRSWVGLTEDLTSKASASPGDSPRKKVRTRILRQGFSCSIHRCIVLYRIVSIPHLIPSLSLHILFCLPGSARGTEWMPRRTSLPRMPSLLISGHSRETHVRPDKYYVALCCTVLRFI